ncbi:hypothetical protein B0H16DRAFT_1718488 [Mycena metata]|uniref:Uncharacterized protein n=1 Tax=Mycena metata TaxID=1033252 RepID=A0AAD7JGD0_9AGAR|nr:hypothetical protein B0H16DRAFT_1718488 [Mycena metata]
MDSRVQELREHIKAEAEALDLSVLPRAAALAEANVVTLSTIPPNALFRTRVPPLDIILHAIRCLLARRDFPGLGHVPDLLDLLTTSEFHRKLMVKKVEEVLTMHHQANNGHHGTLSGGEIFCLNEYEDFDTHIRSIYVELILQYCQYDIYHLWTSNPPRTADTTLRLCQYFPKLNQFYVNAVGHSPRLFHHDLTDIEGKALYDRGLDCCRFVTTSCEWAIAHKLSGQTLDEVFQTPQFRATFPCKVRLSTLRETMEYYVATVGSMFDKLQALCPPT